MSIVGPEGRAESFRIATPGFRPFLRVAGFTLLELLVALVVTGVAISILIRLYNSSASLAKTARNYEIAAQVAEELLVEIESRPGDFEWPDYETGGGEFAAIKNGIPGSSDVPFAVAPATLPMTKRAYERERDLYEGLLRQAFVRLPHSDSNFIEIIVEVK